MRARREPDPAPAISVVLCARNAASTIDAQLQGLARQVIDRAWELLVVDNGCTDATMDIVSTAALPAPVRIIDARDVAGLAHARNVGVAAAAAPLVAFCDADDVVEPGWLAALLAAFADADYVGGRLDVTGLNSAAVVEWRGGSPTVDGLPVAYGYLPYAVGANFAVRRSLFDQIGGCDERFTICCDDIDLSWRAQEAGGVLAYAAAAAVQYRLRADLRDVARQQWRYGTAEPMLLRKFPDRMRWGGWPDALRSWRYLLTRPDHLVRGPRLRGRYVRVAAYRAGRIAGALRHRTWWL